MLVHLSSFGSMPSSLLVIGIFRIARLRKMPARSAGAWFPFERGVGHAGDGGWGYNTHPGASLYIFPIPFEGTDSGNRIGRRTVMPMCSGALWQKFGATKTMVVTLEACERPVTATQSGLLTGNGHRHTKWPVGSKSVRIRPGARVTQADSGTLAAFVDTTMCLHRKRKRHWQFLCAGKGER